MTSPHDQLDLYLDGLLPPAERAAFERRLDAEPALAALVARQRSIDACLKKQFAPPDFGPAIAPLSVSPNGQATGMRLSPESPGHIPHRRKFLAAAAVIGLLAFFGWRFSGYFAPVDDRYAPKPWRSLEAIYQEKVASGFQVDWECKDDEEFSNTFRSRLGQHLLLAQLPPNVQSLGLAYCNSISPNTVFLLARVDGREVIVFADRLFDDKPQPPLRTAGLSLFRREIDSLVLYELTPSAEPKVLPHFYNPRPKRRP